MKLRCSLIKPPILALLCVLGVSTTMRAQTPGGGKLGHADDASSAEAGSLQKKASEAEDRIRGNESDRDQLRRAVKLNEVALAREVLLRNGFTAQDLENATIALRTGGGKGGEDTITISVTCCDPKEITIRRTLENFTKTKP